MDCEGFLILLHRSLWLDHGFIFSLAYGWITDLFSLMREKTLKLKIFSEYSKRKKKKKGLNGVTKVITAGAVFLACLLFPSIWSAISFSLNLRFIYTTGASKRAYSGPSPWYIINKTLHHYRH